MKHLFIITIFLCFSCSPKEANLIGSWKFEENYYSYIVDDERFYDMSPPMFDSLILNPDGSCLLFHQWDSVSNLTYCNWSYNDEAIKFTNRVTNADEELPDVYVPLGRVNKRKIILEFPYEITFQNEIIQTHLIEKYTISK
ncbi:MAG: hypothetical protein WBB45_07695 [Cyclobacteriaceae bacterium]